jgi:uncharacterized membrane protein
MNFLSKLFAAADALQAGKSLQDSAKWKKRELLIIPFTVILSTIFKFMGLDIDENTVNLISGGLAALAVILHGYFTVATTDKLGIKGK